MLPLPEGVGGLDWRGRPKASAKNELLVGGGGGGRQLFAVLPACSSSTHY